jgi:hypothetical protein
MPLTNQHCMCNKIKSQLNSRNVFYTAHNSSSHMLLQQYKTRRCDMWMTQAPATNLSKMSGNGLEYTFLRIEIMYCL